MKLSAAVLAIVLTGAAGGEESRDPNEGLGKVAFRTTCSEAGQAAFKTGLLLLHHMMYRQSAEAFEKSAAADPDCAMAQWGIAMSKFHPLWPGGPTQEETAAGRAAAARLAKMDHGSMREALFIKAVLAFYDGEDVPYRARLAAWAKAQRAILDTFPHDHEALAFASLAQLSVAPRGTAAMPDLIEAGVRMDKLRAESAGHPGALHYAIHAYDHPALVERGLGVSQLYAATAPAAPHALHLPTHIFTRLGLWEDSIALNMRSANAALTQSGDDIISVHYTHAVDYAVYAYLQLGRVDKAKDMLAAIEGFPNLADYFGTAFAVAAAPARISLEQDDWKAAARLSSALHPAISWERYPQVVAIRWFAIGIGAARSGDEATARKALAQLAGLGARMKEEGKNYWLALLHAQTKGIEAWLAYADDDDALAVVLMRESADIEDSVGKAPVTPGHVLPARELLGDLLLTIGHAAAAKEAYQEVLRTSPNRRRSLNGLSRASGQ